MSIDFRKPFSEIKRPKDIEKIATRLGARDWLLPLEPALLSPFGQTLSHPKVPDWMKPSGQLDDEPVLEVLEDGRIRWSGAIYRYDRFGLQKA